MDEILTLLRNGGDTFATAERIERDQAEAGHLAVAKRYFALLNDLYWKAKDVGVAVNIGQLGVHYCLTHAIGRSAEEANQLRDIAKQLAFNIGSYAWPGWAEPGITITPSVIDIGRDASRLNLRLAIELNRPAKGMANAHWLIGAYALVNRQTSKEAEAFERAAAFAEEAKDAAAAAMNRAYAALAGLAAQGNDTFHQNRFKEAMAALAAIHSDDSNSYLTQIDTARKVFTSGSPQ